MNPEEINETPKCSHCDKDDAQEPHTCPFSEEIYDNHETLCDCCEECTYQCIMDI